MCQHQPRCPQSWEPVIGSVAARRARENCDYVRTLLARKQPEFARALTSAEQELPCQAVACRSGSRIARAAAPISERR